MTTRELLLLWIEALESGRYEQARFALRQEAGGYCCLGVLCDVSKLGTWKHVLVSADPDLRIEFAHEKWVYEIATGRNFVAMPDDMFAIETGLEWELFRELTLLNDFHGVDFRQIAQDLRDNVLPNYF